MEYFSWICSLLTNDARCTRENKYGIALAKERSRGRKIHLPEHWN
jgi:hypothetical protein